MITWLPPKFAVQFLIPCCCVICWIIRGFFPILWKGRSYIDVDKVKLVFLVSFQHSLPFLVEWSAFYSISLPLCHGGRSKETPYLTYQNCECDSEETAFNLRSVLPTDNSQAIQRLKPLGNQGIQVRWYALHLRSARYFLRTGRSLRLQLPLVMISWTQPIGLPTLRAWL